MTEENNKKMTRSVVCGKSLKCWAIVHRGANDELEVVAMFPDDKRGDAVESLRNYCNARCEVSRVEIIEILRELNGTPPEVCGGSSVEPKWTQEQIDDAKKQAVKKLAEINSGKGGGE